jgi:eukaryotic-like serine/threonine-protein kinase
MGLLEIHEVVNGKYRVQELLGGGSFGEVYRVENLDLDRQEAMKVFELAEKSDKAIADLGREAKILSRCSSANIVVVYDSGKIEQRHGDLGFFTMEFFKDGNLEAFVRNKRGPPRSAEVSVGIIKQICKGLQEAHRKNPPLIHRDLKPQNILIDKSKSDLRVCICDFGLAKQVNLVTQRASASGTEPYKPPESFETSEDSCASDVWAIGIMLYELLTGKYPFPLESRDFGRKIPIFKDGFQSATKLNSEVDESLEAIIAKSLANDHGKRFQTAGELLAALAGWMPDPGLKNEPELRNYQSLRESDDADPTGSIVAGRQPPLREGRRAYKSVS